MSSIIKLAKRPFSSSLQIRSFSNSFTTQTPPILPESGKRNILITSALPYVNNVPHLGNIIGSVLSADTYARYCRSMGYNCIYICGTDEYGTATETKAHQEGLSPKEICDKYHKVHKSVYDWFDIKFDKFGRTTTPAQTEIASKIFLKLYENQELVEKTVEQCFCENCQKFLADRFVLGTCPSCSFAEARGDQCDGCGKILNPEELVEARCFLCKSKTTVKSSDHVFLNLPSIKKRLQNWINESSKSGNWSNNCLKTTESWVKEGLKPRCITRDLKWGTPVPLDRYRDKVFYVWFDAPIGYISITASYTENWELWWKNPEVELVQFMGKDNIPFHTVMFPASLLATGEAWTLVKTISSTEYLNYENGKFSKSRGVGVFGDDVLSTEIPADVYRYYLLSNRPEVADSVFKWSDLADKANNELLPNLGNLVNRVLKFAEKRKIHPVPCLPDKPDLRFLTSVFILVKTYLYEMESIKLKTALKTAMEVSMITNKYLQDSKFWSLKIDSPDLSRTLWVALSCIRLIALLLEPFMPSFSAQVYTQLGLDTSGQRDLLKFLSSSERPEDLLKLIEGEVLIRDVKPIFKAISEEQVSILKSRFSGRHDK